MIITHNFCNFKIKSKISATTLKIILQSSTKSCIMIPSINTLGGKIMCWFRRKKKKEQEVQQTKEIKVEETKVETVAVEPETKEESVVEKKTPAKTSTAKKSTKKDDAAAPKKTTANTTKKQNTKKEETKKETKTQPKKVEETKVEEEPKTKKPIYRVIYDKEAKVWAIKKDGAKRTIATFSTKEEALNRVKSLSASKELNFIVHKKDGKFQKK